MADLVVPEKIKKLDALFTWPHSSEEGRFVSAAFVTTDKDKQYLIYAPCCKSELGINEYIEREEDYFWFRSVVPVFPDIKTVKLESIMYSDKYEVKFYFIPLFVPESKKIKRKDVEKMFGVKVVD